MAELAKLYFSDFFEVSPEAVDRYGAFNVSLLADLPLFIDPFLLFNSRRPTYQHLHAQIVRYLKFLRAKSTKGHISPELLSAWYKFPEVKQTWLGFTLESNDGRGLGKEFAEALNSNLNTIFGRFGRERITRGSHLEKLCLIKENVGRDCISDFTTNLIIGFLADYTEDFAKKKIKRAFRKTFSLQRARFNYETETWVPRRYELPAHQGDYVLLVPKDLLTKDENWINKRELVEDFQSIPDAIPDAELRAQVNNYFLKLLPKEPKKEDTQKAALETILKYPDLVDYYIRLKEDTGQRAVSISKEKVARSRELYIQQFSQLPQMLSKLTHFYAIPRKTYSDAKKRVEFLKDVIENKGGHRVFYLRGKPLERETDLHILYRLTWFASLSDVGREVNDGRGPVDFKVSRGSKDKTLVEFKLASNTQLKRNLSNQVEIYKKASDANRAIKVIVCFSEEQQARVKRILNELGLSDCKDIVLIDARNDNKPSGSKAA